MPEAHFPPDATLVLMVDRYSAYKAMSQVKAGNILLAFCWAHVRRDFVEVGKGWAELKPWALALLERIRELYRCQRERRKHAQGSVEFATADAALRQLVGQMKAQAEQELGAPGLRAPCRKVLISLQEHWIGLTRFVDDLRIPLDNNASEREERGPAVGRKNYYGSCALWSGRLLAMLFSLKRHVAKVPAESTEMVDMVSGKLRGSRRPGSRGHQRLSALEPDGRKARGNGAGWN